jgi:ATP-dependent RNA helicase CshB
MNKASFPFSSFALEPDFVQALATLGYHQATPVQQVVIPSALRGESLIARFETGSGKTHAFLIPSFARLDAQAGLQLMIVSPTRELVTQTYQFAKAIADAAFPWVKIMRLTGGTALEDDVHALKQEPNVLCLTPGRLTSVLQAMSHTPFQRIKTLVLDEADMLLDASFVHDVDAMLKTMEAPQLLVFSASLSKPLLGMLRAYIRPDHIFEPTEKTVNNTQVNHLLVDTRHQEPVDAFLRLVDHVQPYRMLVFASTVDRIQQFHASLTAKGLTVGLLHGDMGHRERKMMLRRIAEGEFTLICASDIAARGMDLQDISDVVSLDLPRDLAYYFHRAGRTGRYRASGTSYVFYTKDQQRAIDTLTQKGITFTRMTLKASGLKQAAPERTWKHVEQPELKRDIKKAIQRYASKEVKPGYKKKVKRAVERVKQKYKRKAIDAVIRKRLYGGKKDE